MILYVASTDFYKDIISHMFNLRSQDRKVDILTQRKPPSSADRFYQFAQFLGSSTFLLRFTQILQAPSTFQDHCADNRYTFTPFTLVNAQFTVHLSMFGWFSHPITAPHTGKSQIFKETEIAIKFYLYAKRILIRLPKQIFVDGILNGRKEYEWKERKGEF